MGSERLAAFQVAHGIQTIGVNTCYFKLKSLVILNL